MTDRLKKALTEVDPITLMPVVVSDPLRIGGGRKPIKLAHGGKVGGPSTKYGKKK